MDKNSDGFITWESFSKFISDWIHNSFWFECINKTKSIIVFGENERLTYHQLMASFFIMNSLEIDNSDVINAHLKSYAGDSDFEYIEQGTVLIPRLNVSYNLYFSNYFFLS